MSPISVIDLGDDEYIKSIEGTIGSASSKWGGNTVVRSLEIETNSGTLVPTAGGQYAKYSIPLRSAAGNEIVGFYGGQEVVDAIGVVAIRSRYVPTEPDYKVYKLGPAGIPRSGTLVETGPLARRDR